MLKRLALHDVGPTTRMALDPVAPRFNLIAGDNGLGKSFLLEAAWWVLTRTWHETPAVPNTPTAAIEFTFDAATKPYTSKTAWSPEAQEWKWPKGAPPNPGLVLYARIDGSFSVWDPARNLRIYQRKDGGEGRSPTAYQFSSSAVLEGLRRTVTEAGATREQVLCSGLIDDWTRWQDAEDDRFALLCQLLDHLGPDEQPLRPGAPLQPTLDDERRIPTIKMPYGKDIPLTYAPAGVRRMAKLAYLLTWAFSKHQTESERIKKPMASQVIMLIDEPETHLHPRWQRTVLPSLAKSLTTWSASRAVDVQFLVATHSPLVLASMEPEFDAAKDALWKLDMAGDAVRVERDRWHRRGDVNRWLVSDVFDLGRAVAPATERALSDATALMASAAADPVAVRALDARLVALLPEMDPFFIRWRLRFGDLFDAP